MKTILIVAISFLFTINSFIYYFKPAEVIQLTTKYNTISVLLEKNVHLEHCGIKSIVKKIADSIKSADFEKTKYYILSFLSFFSLQSLLDYAFDFSNINDNSDIYKYLKILKGFKNYVLISNTDIEINIKRNKIAPNKYNFTLPTQLSQISKNIQFSLIETETKRKLLCQTITLFESENNDVFNNFLWKSYLTKNKELKDLTEQITIENDKLIEKKILLMRRNKDKKRCKKFWKIKYPTKPKYACDNKDKTEIATAMCVALVGGSELCGKFASIIGNQQNMNLYNFLSAPSCSALVSNLLDEKFTISDLIGSTLIGIFDDFGNSLVDSNRNSISGHFLKSMSSSMKLNSFYKCIEKAKLKCTDAYTDWRFKINHFDRKYKHIKVKCDLLSDYIDDVKIQVDYISRLENKKKHIINDISKLERTSQRL